MAPDLVPLPPDLYEADPPITDDDLEQFADATAGMEAGPADAAVYLMEWYTPGGPAAAAASWEARDPLAAEWAMRKLVQARQEIAAAERHATAWHAQVDDWVKRETRKAQATEALMEAKLENYGRRVRDESDGKVKSVRLPSGDVRTTGASAAVELSDPAVVLAWVRDHLPPSLQREVVAAPEPPAPTVTVTGLRKFARPVMVVDEWEAVCSPCGCVVAFKGMPSLEVGTGTECPSCGDEALVARLQAVAAHWEVQDGDGHPVPGASVREPTVTVKVVPDA